MLEEANSSKAKAMLSLTGDWLAIETSFGWLSCAVPMNHAPSRLENTKPSDRQIKYLIYHLEIASRMADESGGDTEMLAVHFSCAGLYID